MSVVVAIKDKDKVIVGCDSQVTRGYSKKTLSNMNNFKIFKPTREGDIIIGVCGDLRDRDILYCVDEYIDELTRLKDTVNYKYIATRVVPHIFQILKHNGRVVSKEDEISHLEVELIFVYKNQIYTISSWGTVMEIDDYCAIGSGADFAIGYLNESPKKDVRQDIIKSIKSACKNDLYVNYPIIIMNSEDNIIDIIEK